MSNSELEIVEAPAASEARVQVLRVSRTERRQMAGEFRRLPGSRKPFRRVHEYHQKFIDLLAATAGMLPIDREMALRALPPYVSRGHGGRHRPTQRIVGSKQFQDRSKYMPAEEDRRHLDVGYGERMTKKLYYRSTPAHMRATVERLMDAR